MLSNRDQSEECHKIERFNNIWKTTFGDNFDSSSFNQQFFSMRLAVQPTSSQAVLLWGSDHCKPHSDTGAHHIVYQHIVQLVKNFVRQDDRRLIFNLLLPFIEVLVGSGR